MLIEYKGPANSRGIFRHLVGEKIVAAFMDKDGKAVLVMESGEGISFGNIGGGAPCYYKMSVMNIHDIVSERRKEIEGKLAELRDLPGVDLP